MAFRHFGGSVPPVRVAWTCPTCGDKQMGALEAGCTKCQAGADAKKAAPKFIPEADVEAENVHAAFIEWSSMLRDVASQTLREHGEAAFKAGAAWQRQQLDTVVRVAAAAQATTPNSEGGYLLAMVTPDTHESTLIDQRTHDTILAALAFYRDNQVAYGTMPGQLDAAEVSALITKLTSPEAESAK